VTRPGGDRSVLNNAVYALANQVVTAACTAVLTIYLVRALGPLEYGVFALAMSVAALVLLPADFGISQSTSRFLAERRGRREAAAAVLRSAIGLRLVISIPVALATWFMAEPIAEWYSEPDVADPLRAMAVVLLGQSFVILFRGVFNGLSRVDRTFWMIAFESVAETAASIAFVIASATAASAAWGRAVGYGAGALVGLVLVVRLLGRHAVSVRGGGEPSDVPIGAIARYAGAMFIIDGAFTLFEQIDVLLIGAFLGAAAAGVFQAPLKLVTFLHYPGLAIATAVTPRLARREDRSALDAFHVSLRLVTIVQFGLGAAVLVWAQPLADLALGKGYEESADVLRALAPFVVLSGLAPLVSLAVNYLGEARRRVPIAIAAVAVNFALDVVLIPEIGIVAGAIGTGVAYAIYVAAHIRLCHRILHLDLAALGRTVARTLLACAVMAACLAAWGTEELSALGWIGGIVSGTALFAGVLIVTRELTAGDVAFVRARFARG
jgi:O-antigen/teichoic acid export membrane protein